MATNTKAKGFITITDLNDSRSLSFGISTNQGTV